MRQTFILLSLLLLGACQKEQTAPAISRTDFFTSASDARQKVQQLLDKRPGGGQLKSIERINYIDSKNKSWAFVYYRSNLGSSQIVLQQQYLNGKILPLSSITCSGTDCDCKVVTTISMAGDVTVNCSCSSCTMNIN